MNSSALNKSRRQQSSYDSNQQLRTILLASLAKLHSQSTAQTGFSELRSLIAQLSLNQFVILTNLLDSNDLSKQAKKDYIKVFGLLAEIRGNDIEEQIPRIVQIINKRIQEGDSSFLQVISDIFANINEFTIQTSLNKYDLFFQITELLQSNFVHHNKVAQLISAASLCRIIKTSESQLLELVCKQYTQKTLEILKSPHCQTQQGLLESLLSIILTVEEIFEPNLEDCLNTICNCLQSSEWNSRKIAVDILYTLSVIFPHYFRANDQYQNKINELRFDKIKHVRDAATNAITQLKESHIFQQPSFREHKSVFKQNANKSFFEKKPDDIQIVENKPRDFDLQKQQAPRQEYHLKSEVYFPKQNYQQFSNEKKQSQIQIFTENNLLVSPHQEQIQLIQSPYKINSACSSSKKKQINLSQEIQTSQQVLNSSTPKKQQQQTDLIKLCDSAKAKQQVYYEQLINNRIQESQLVTKQEFSKINQRIDRIELLLEKMNDTINRKLNQQEQQQSQQQQQQQQQQLLNQKQKVQLVATYEDQMIPCLLHQEIKQNQQLVSDSLDVASQDQQQQNSKIKDSFFFCQKCEQNSESKLGESNFELNSRKISETEGKEREHNQKSTSEASPLRNRDQSILTNDSKLIKEQNSPPIQVKDPKIQEQQKIMLKVEEQLKKDNINEAYCTALTSLDDQIIISTMMKTGPCTERLDSTQVEFLLHKLRTLDWIENALQHHLARMPAILLKSISLQLNNIKTSDQVKRIQDLIEKKNIQPSDQQNFGQ
ncbi:unnamed protein product [Paramecium sonneborni]|uniref:TORTIFOLIA1/SINE1-2 N-terminal domain-containing protein n=1 Tax=Paramecium sonneborni TaxID=65129 RepID=A0A8S1K2E2_9CILI|nr:unnamed protein product [Paramecium sonneborni]